MTMPPSATATTTAQPLSKSAEQSSSSSSSAAVAKEIQSLLNHFSSCQSDHQIALALDQLRKIFTTLLETGELGTSHRKESSHSATATWKSWLTRQHDRFLHYLAKFIQKNKLFALRTFCGVVASTPTIPSEGDPEVDHNDRDNGKPLSRMVNVSLLNQLLEALLRSKGCLAETAIDNNNAANVRDNTIRNNQIVPDSTISYSSSEDRIMEEDMLTLFESELVRPYRDVQYFLFQNLRRISIDLLEKLERLVKDTQKDTSASKTSDRKEQTIQNEIDVGGEECANTLVVMEKSVGIVAENICRLLLRIDYVPVSNSELIEEENTKVGMTSSSNGRFLFPPPILKEKTYERMNDDEQSEEEEEEEPEVDIQNDSTSSADDDSEGSVSEDDQEESEGSSTKIADKQKLPNKNTRLIAWQRSYKHRFAFQEAWLSVLRLPGLPIRTRKHVLQHLSTYVLPICPTPLRFAEYFSRSFQEGTVASSSRQNTSHHPSHGLTAVLSLQGLFHLMLDHRLEYPQFYTSLYQLLHPRILYTKHRTQFLRLLSQSLLHNNMLPAYVIASFCKKLCRLAIVAPPSGALFVLALVSNLLRKHGECACLIHRKGNMADDEGKREETFVEEVNELIDTRALESSLWELSALEKHYHPAVSALAKSCGREDDSTPMYDMEEFLTHSYQSLFEQEKKRVGELGGLGAGGKGKKARVSLTFVEPSGLFHADDVFGSAFKSSG